MEIYRKGKTLSKSKLYSTIPVQLSKFSYHLQITLRNTFSAGSSGAAVLFPVLAGSPRKEARKSQLLAQERAQGPAWEPDTETQEEVMAQEEQQLFCSCTVRV